MGLWDGKKDLCGYLWFAGRFRASNHLVFIAVWFLMWEEWEAKCLPLRGAIPESVTVHLLMDSCVPVTESEVEFQQVTWGAFCKELMCIRSHFYKTDSDHHAPLCLYVCLELNEDGEYMEDHRLGCFVWDFRQDRSLGTAVERGSGQASKND